MNPRDRATGWNISNWLFAFSLLLSLTGAFSHFHLHGDSEPAIHKSAPACSVCAVLPSLVKILSVRGENLVGNVFNFLDAPNSGPFVVLPLSFSLLLPARAPPVSS